jgi:hypothetical protein
MKHAPHTSPIRRGATLFNVWDNRAEGMATAMEEIILHAGYYDDNPRAREIVWIMLAQRAARGLASLYAQANDFDIAKAKAFQVEWTPRGWMRPDLDLRRVHAAPLLRRAECGGRDSGDAAALGADGTETGALMLHLTGQWNACTLHWHV